MPSRILEMIKAKVSQLPKEKPKPQQPIKEQLREAQLLSLNESFRRKPKKESKKSDIKL